MAHRIVVEGAGAGELAAEGIGGRSLVRARSMAATACTRACAATFETMIATMVKNTTETTLAGSSIVKV